MDDLIYFYPDGHAAHAQPGHPERPERVDAIVAGLRAANLWDPFPKVEPVLLSLDQLKRVHTASYLEILQAASRRGAWLDADTYTTPASWELAIRAAGGAVSVAQAVWNGRARRGLALTRPPGHHATVSRGMGFCLINNIAVAAEELHSGAGPERLAIVDLDLHHGNGTQEIFWTREDVLFISTHQAPFYPGTGAAHETGTGRGAGFTANFPLPAGTGDRGYAAVMDELIIPLLDRYSPQMILVSFGFDPHWRDPLGSMLLSAGGLHGLISRLTKWVNANCDGKIAIFLEGGYDLEAGKACASATVASLLDRPWNDQLGPSPHPENDKWIARLLEYKNRWQV